MWLVFWLKLLELSPNQVSTMTSQKQQTNRSFKKWFKMFFISYIDIVFIFHSGLRGSADFRKDFLRRDESRKALFFGRCSQPSFELYSVKFKFNGVGFEHNKSWLIAVTMRRTGKLFSCPVNSLKKQQEVLMVNSFIFFTSPEVPPSAGAPSCRRHHVYRRSPSGMLPRSGQCC